MDQSEPTRDRTAPTTGSLEDGMAMLGRRSPVNFGSHPVAEVRVAQYCALIEDPNPSYWNAAASAKQWGRPVAPPAMLQTFTMPLPWLPDREVELDFMLMKLPMPGNTIINVSTDIVYHRPIYVGETLNFWDVATDISEKKETRLGVGHFVTTVATYQNEAGEKVATATNVQFRFTPRNS
jgi:acyl dehydratase